MQFIRQLVLVTSLMIGHFVGRILGRYSYRLLTHERFVAVFEKLFASAASRDDYPVKSFHFVNLSSEVAPWLDTGIDLSEGDVVTTLATGRVFLSKALNLWAGPAFQFWYKLGEAGVIQRGLRDTHTFICPSRQRLFVAGLNPGSWADEKGTPTVPASAYKKGMGRISVAVIIWKGAARPGIDKLRAASGWSRVDEDIKVLLEAEARRLDEPAPVLEDWRYLWELGDGEIYGLKDSAGHRCMQCHTKEDVGILQKEVSFPLTPETRLQWDWKVDELPSIHAEDTVPTHDYLSIAVEFENGRDLTYYWSARLPVETSYHCPLPNWNHRETHLVVRSGSKGLGEWLSEDRNIYDDYLKAIGEPPVRIVKVWFIAVSIFQRRQGRCEYRNVKLVNEEAAKHVL